MRDDLSALPGQTRRALATSLRALIGVVATGRSPTPPRRATGTLPTRLIMVGTATAVTAIWAYLNAFHQSWPLVDTALLAPVVVLTPLSVALTYNRPLVAWRLAAVLFAVSPAVFRVSDILSYFENTWQSGPAWLDVALAITLYAVAERHRPAELIWVGLLSLIAGIPRHWHATNNVLLAVLVIGILLAGSTVRLRRRANEQQLRRAEARADAAALQERARIARELHDVVAHHMSVLALRADSAPYRLTDLSKEVRAEFADLSAIARDGLTDMRRLLGVLRADNDAGMTAPQPNLEQVGDLVDRVRATGAAVSVSMTAESAALPASLGLSAYRIVQEALSNATRHAPGAAVRVEVCTDNGALRVDVRNAPGSSTSNPAVDRPGHGLLGMRERVTVLGGRFHAGPTADGGFAVSATLPLDVTQGGIS